MSMNQVEDLWTRFMAEGRLSPSEEQELLDALEADPALRARLLGDKQMDGLIDALSTTDRDAEAFAKSFQDRLAVEGDDSKFIAKVEERIRRAPARPPRRFAGRPESTPWTLGLIAAGVFAAIVVIVMLSSTETPAPVVKRVDPPKIREVEPPTPPPPPIVETARAPEKPIVPPAPIDVKPPEPPPPPKPEVIPTPVVPEPEKKPPPVRTVTKVIVARVDRVEGEVAVQAGHPIAAGRGLEVGKGAATIVYPDGTKLDLGAQTTVLDLVDAGNGKTLTMEKGVLTADVVKQPQPMIVKTPHAEIRVLGTTLRVTIEPGSTRLDVLSGKVRLTRALDGKYVDVITGHYAVAGAGVEMVAKPSAPKPKAMLLQENFQDPRGVDARWKIVGTAAAIKTAGQLDIDLATKASGWSGAGLISRQTFAAPMAVLVDVDLPVLHASVVAAVVFIPQGQKRGDAGVFRVQLRDNRYSLTVETGEARDLAGADRTGGAPCRERWRIEVDGPVVRFLAGDREIFRTKHELTVPPGYSIEIDGSARADAPSGSRAGFDNVVVEPLK
jgi:FecR-like protein